MVLEAVAGDAARSDEQEPPHHKGSGARRQAPVQVCKKDERQTKALLAKVRYWSAHM